MNQQRAGEWPEGPQGSGALAWRERQKVVVKTSDGGTFDGEIVHIGEHWMDIQAEDTAVRRFLGGHYRLGRAHWATWLTARES